MDQKPAARPLDPPPPYDSSMGTKTMDTPKHDQTQHTKTKTQPNLNQVNRMVSGKIQSTGLPESMLSATPPPIINYPDELAYPNELIKKGNVIYPAQDLSFPLYYLPEATYYSNVYIPRPSTYLYKRHGTMHEFESSYTTVGSKPKCYSAFAIFYDINTQGWKHGWQISGGEFKIELSVQGLLWNSTSALSIRKIYSYTSKPIVIKRNAQSGNTSENGSLKTHSWVDSTTNKVLAWEFQTTPGTILSGPATRPSSSEENRLEFANEALGKQLRDILTAAWCISLWVDAEAARRNEEGLMQNKGIFGRLAKMWYTGESSAGSSKPEPNKLREQLGLDEISIPEEPRELMWYETGKKSWLGT